ncbi:MAG: hypothetical protein ACQEW2_02280 [Bacillota bacterium]|uniref:hypothetical protein n=1 Tax=Cytobacillus firmus TaxID=1399 RepID=UPI0018CF6763|nr:hypothetical protein [Cytobacillus firmus]MED1907851.1 hypothetical protein [Cytobacillus firmus]
MGSALSQKERLAFLLSYHHNLTLQLKAEITTSSRVKLESSLGALEEEIEAILFAKPV